MKFITRSGKLIDFDPFNQASVDSAKANAPGEGIGPAVNAAWIDRIVLGEVTDLSQMPVEQRLLGQACGLSDAVLHQ